MRAILIDAVERDVREVDYDGSLDSVYQMLRCELIDAVRVSENDSMLVDDEGLLTSDDGDSPFILLRNGSVIAGSALVVGSPDENGDTTSCQYSVEDVAPFVIFATRDELLDKFGIDPQPGLTFFSIEEDQE